MKKQVVGCKEIKSINEDINLVDIFISEPTVDCIPDKLTQKDVWGDGGYNRETKENRGMRVAVYNEKCPIWGDIVPRKSCTVVCDKDVEDEVIYWLEYVYGGDCITRRKEIDEKKVALRAEYTCW